MYYKLNNNDNSWVLIGIVRMLDYLINYKIIITLQL